MGSHGDFRCRSSACIAGVHAKHTSASVCGMMEQGKELIGERYAELAGDKLCLT